MLKNRKIELLAPAKNLECGLVAIEHGADAVYIGAPSFSARASAGNTVDDIKQLTQVAHLFGVKIYVALNTILSDKELIEAEKLIWQLWDEAEIDALIIQDLGITKLNLPPIPLHASTQMDNRGKEKVDFLEAVGFRQIVLPREMSLEEIKEVSRGVNVPLEFFVHGALCVSYSGQCYISQAISQRSANKGNCAQYCRLPYTLRDADKNIIMENKHLLSLKDLNLSDQLEELMDAGISSLKIEGRMKGADYVKNTVSFYRKKLDIILERRSEYGRTSMGHSKINFSPDLYKTFNRDFSNYFLFGRNERTQDIWSLNSPKSIGEQLGTVEDINKSMIRVRTEGIIHTGDGLCFIDENDELKGFSVNKVSNNNIQAPLGIKKGTTIFRNYNYKFQQELSKNNTAKRSLDIAFRIEETIDGVKLSVLDLSRKLSLDKEFRIQKEVAKKDQTENITNTLKKTGDTIFSVIDVEIVFNDCYFIPLSLVSDWRRQLINELYLTIEKHYDDVDKEKYIFQQTNIPFPLTEISHLGNIMNTKAKEFYIQHQCSVKQQAFEIQYQKDVPLMYTKHCVKYSLGVCPKMRNNNTKKYKEPLEIVYKDLSFCLEFDCQKCEMRILKN